jgi:hypothetical protein
VPAKLTTEQFIEKARAIHGDRYDYSRVEYLNNSTNVTIICPEHGPFLQTPSNHRAGKGCSDCAGRKPLNTETFIEKAKAVHGGRYDYSKVKYSNAHSKVTIICPEHGPFSQTPAHHTNQKTGCPECAGKNVTTGKFVERARAVHSDRYDYSQVEYVGRHTKVTIICPEHGPFSQTPGSHLGQKAGCPDCAGNKPLNTESFIERARTVHGNRYDYSQVEYVSFDIHVTIICPEHGSFAATPGNHLNRKSGCPDCGTLSRAEKRRLTHEDFVARAKAIHHDRYDYSRVQYLNNSTNVTIICPDHGPFLQRPDNHLLGKGCIDCSGKKRLTTEAFIERARTIHGDHYDYSQVEYLDSGTPVWIICPEHGPFGQTPDNHYAGKGCGSCASFGFDPNARGILYYIAVTTDDGDTRYKIGVTNRTVEERFSASDLSRIRIVKTWQYATGRKAAEREAKILRQHEGDRYFGPGILRSGNSELFTHDILGLDGAEN